MTNHVDHELPCKTCNAPRRLHRRDHLWSMVKGSTCQVYVWPDKIGTLDRSEPPAPETSIC